MSKGKEKDVVEVGVEEVVDIKSATNPKKGKVALTLDNKAIVNVGSSKEISGGETILVSDWNPGQAPHFSIPFGVLTELVKAGKLIPLGKYGDVDVVDADDALDIVKSAVEKQYGIEWKAGKSGATKAYKETAEAAIKMVMDMAKCDRATALEKLKSFKAIGKEVPEDTE